MTHGQALAILRAGRGAHFEPELLDLFINDLEIPMLTGPPPE
jgi:response regulator RpfG family c-di-GMP phosphodiesterase